MSKLDGIDITKHLRATQPTEISNICKPLNKIGINYFTLDRIFNDNSRAIFTNRPDWIQHYYWNAYYQYKLFDVGELKKEYVLWSDLVRYPVYSDAAEFHVTHGFTIVIQGKLYCDFFNFGCSNATDEHIKTILKNFDFIKRFIIYFFYKAESILNKSTPNKIILPDSKDFIIIGDSANLMDIKSKEEFLKETAINKFYIGKNNSNNYLTRREIECILELNKGNTAKEIALNLNISRRTVEVHLARIKEKFNCKTLYQLGKALSQCSYFDVFFDT